MTHRVHLPDTYDYCPQWWKTLCEKIPYDEDEGYDHIQRIQNFIREHGGSIKTDEDDPETIEFIDFESEAHYTWFLLNI